MDNMDNMDSKENLVFPGHRDNVRVQRQIDLEGHRAFMENPVEQVPKASKVYLDLQVLRACKEFKEFKGITGSRDLVQSRGVV
jgi:hypothetical protein